MLRFNDMDEMFGNRLAVGTNSWFGSEDEDAPHEEDNNEDEGNIEEFVQSHRASVPPVTPPPMPRTTYHHNEEDEDVDADTTNTNSETGAKEN